MIVAGHQWHAHSISTTLRGRFGRRVAFRCDEASSRVVLNSNAAAGIPPRQQGSAVMLYGSEPIGIRSFFLPAARLLRDVTGNGRNPIVLDSEPVKTGSEPVLTRGRTTTEPPANHHRTTTEPLQNRPQNHPLGEVDAAQFLIEELPYSPPAGNIEDVIPTGADFWLAEENRAVAVAFVQTWAAAGLSRNKMVERMGVERKVALDFLRNILS